MTIYYLQKKSPSGRRSIVLTTTSKQLIIEYLHCLTFAERKMFRVLSSKEVCI